MFSMNAVKSFSFGLILLALVVMGLSACTGSYTQKDSYVGKSGATVSLESDRQSCTASCNAEYDRCGESNAAQAPVGRGAMTGVLGAKASCQDALRRCLAHCKTR